MSIVTEKTRITISMKMPAWKLELLQKAAVVKGVSLADLILEQFQWTETSSER